MISVGWKTVIIESQAVLSFKDDCLHVEGDITFDVPVSQIRILLIDSLFVTVTSYLLNELQNNGVRVVFCNEKHSPCTELTPLHEHSNQSGCIQEQIHWNEDMKSVIWQLITDNKIFNQINLLEKLNLETPDEIKLYLNDVQLGDVTNREGQAARVYFHSLFGPDFIRMEETTINAMLNYGYAILLSAVNRKITSMGYLTNIGIHHCKDTNPFNLSCDIMEPFRPIIDSFVYSKRENTVIDRNFKNFVVSCFYKTIDYNGKSMQLYNAIDRYTEDILRAMKDGIIPEFRGVRFES